ncbi:MAG: WD40 repeat domain-containing protein [Bryobacteraceae bacterium]
MTRTVLFGLIPLVLFGAPASTVHPIYSLAWSPDGQMIAVGGFREVRLMDATGKQVKAKLEGPTDAVRAIAYSMDGSLLAAGAGLPGRKGEITVWKGSEKIARMEGHADCIYAVAFSPDAKLIATSSYDKLIKLWNVASGKEVRTLKDHIDAVYALSFTPDGKRLMSGSADRTVKIWDVASGERLYTLSEPTDGINTIALDPTGRMVAAGGLDKTIRVWSLGEKGGKLLETQIAHEDQILRLAWSPDGTTLVSASADKTIKFLRLPNLEEVRVIDGQSDWANGLAFSPDGRSLAVGRYDGSITVYAVETKAGLGRAGLREPHPTEEVAR